MRLVGLDWKVMGVGIAPVLLCGAPLSIYHGCYTISRLYNTHMKEGHSGCGRKGEAEATRSREMDGG